jgi:hypothetical protein
MGRISQEEGMVSQSMHSSNFWLGATWTSVLVVSVFSLFMAALFGAAVATHAAHHAIGLTGVGTAMFAILGLYQAKMLLKQRNERGL